MGGRWAQPAVPIAIIANEMDKLLDLQHQVSKTEYEADLIKDNIRQSLPPRYFLPVDRDHVVEALAEGRGDILGKPVAINDEWKKYGDFTAPIRENISYIAVTGPKSPALSKLEDLSGKEVCVHKMSAFYLALQKLN